MGLAAKDLAKKVSLLNDTRRIPAHPGTLADDVERTFNNGVKSDDNMYRNDMEHKSKPVRAWTDMVHRIMVAEGHLCCPKGYVDVPPPCDIPCCSGGRWLPLGEFRPGLRIRATRRTHTIDEIERVIPKRLRGTVCEVDEDGDAVVFFPALGPKHADAKAWIARQDVGNFEKFQQHI